MGSLRTACFAGSPADCALALVAVALLVTVGSAHAASFDCAKASSAVEKAICGDAELGALDVSLADAYVKAARADPGVKRSQRDWLKKRNACVEKSCIRVAYEERLQALDPNRSPTPSASSPSRFADAAMGWVEQHLWVLAVPAVLLAMLVRGIARRCPECHKWNSTRVVGRELLDQSPAFKTVTRKDEHRNRNGELIRTVERQEQVRVVVSTFMLTHRCKACGHEWTSREKTDTE